MLRARPTVKDVAARAGVSPKTVSNVLTGTVPVREETRARVEQAMRDLDFVPNLSARGLRNGRSGVIAIALPDLSTAFSGAVLQLAVREAHARGVAMLVEETAEDPAREVDLISRARAHLIDGLILNPVTVQDSAVSRAENLPPVVVIGEVATDRTDHVWIDSRAAARDVAAHVLDRGARRIAALGAPGVDFPTETARLRLAGIRDALAERGDPGIELLEVPCLPWRTSAAAVALGAALDRGAEPDAVIAFTDSLAIGAEAALHARGLAVPGDVLVTGFDDLGAEWADPPLTTVRFDLAAYVRTAFELLDARTADRDRPIRRITIPHEVVERASTTRPRSVPTPIPE